MRGGLQGGGRMGGESDVQKCKSDDNSVSTITRGARYNIFSLARRLDGWGDEAFGELLDIIVI